MPCLPIGKGQRLDEPAMARIGPLGAPVEIDIPEAGQVLGEQFARGKLPAGDGILNDEGLIALAPERTVVRLDVDDGEPVGQEV